MFCGKCGTELPDNAMFCQNCGNPVNDAIRAEKGAPKRGKPAKTKKRSPGMKVLTVVLVVVLVLGGGTGLFFALLNTKVLRDVTTLNVFRSDETKVTNALARYFEAYEALDADALEKSSVPKDLEEQIEDVTDYIEFYRYSSDNEKAAFINATQIPNSYTTFLTIIPDSDSEVRQLIEDAYPDFDLKYDYEVVDIYSPDEMDTIGYFKGLMQMDIDADERIDEIFDRKVDNWYAVTVDVKWYVNDDLYGINRELRDEILSTNSSYDFLSEMYKDDAETSTED